MRSSRRLLSRLTGIFVMAAMLLLLLNFVYAPSCGEWSCSFKPGWAAADSGSCPGNIDGAASDGAWAGDRIAQIADEKLTVGLFYDADGMPHNFDSTKDADADKALKVGRDAGVFPQSGRPNVVNHVEVKVAAAMRDSGETTGVLVINNAGGPCGRTEGGVDPASCLAFLPKLLPTGATLTVWWPDPGGGTPHRQTFTGG